MEVKHQTQGWKKKDGLLGKIILVIPFSLVYAFVMND
jgi:hypothetical protein